MSQFERDFTEYDPYAVLELERVRNHKWLEYKMLILNRQTNRLVLLGLNTNRYSAITC